MAWRFFQSLHTLLVRLIVLNENHSEFCSWFWYNQQQFCHVLMDLWFLEKSFIVCSNLGGINFGLDAILFGSNWTCCNLSVGVALIVWFTTNGTCVKNNIIIYVARASNSRRDCEHDLYCCLLPRCEALCTCRSGFPIATKWCCDQDVKVVRSSASTQRTCDRCGSL